MATEVTKSRQMLCLIAALAMAISMMVITADEALAAPPDPQVTYMQGQPMRNTGDTGCIYPTVWALSDLNGRFASFEVEASKAGSAFASIETVERDLHQDPYFRYSFNVLDPQPAFVQVRVRAVKKSGSPITEWAFSTELTCTTSA
jgi:hypothetical protein